MATKGYEIPVTANTDALTKGIDQAAKRLEEFYSQTQRMAQNAKGGGGYGGGRSGAGQVNPYDRLRDLNNLHGPYASENAQRWADVQRARAQKAVDRADRDLGGGADALKTMLMRTRLKIGNFQPLIGDLIRNGILSESTIDGMIAKIAGNPAMAAAVTKLAGIAGIAASVGAGYVTWGMERDRSFSRGYYSGGGSEGYGQAAGLGSFIGAGPGDIGEIAQGLAQKLQGGGYGAAKLRSLGIIDKGSYLQPNKYPNFIKTIDALRGMSELDKMRVLNDLGMPELGRFTDLSPSAYNQLKNSMGDIGQNRGASADVDARYESIKNSGASFISRPWEWLKHDMSEQERLTSSGKYGKAALNAIYTALKWGTGNIARVFDNFGHPQDGPGSTKAAIEKNTEAINLHTRTIKDGGEFIGGGPRGRLAWDHLAWKGLMFEANSDSMTRQLGAFVV